MKKRGTLHQNFRRRIVLAGGRSFDVTLVAERRRHGSQRGFAIWFEHDPGTLDARSVLFERFVPEDDLWLVLLALGRVVERHARDVERSGIPMRLGRVVDRFGIEGFRALVRAERAIELIGVESEVSP